MQYMKWIDAPELTVPYYTFENLEHTAMVEDAFTTRLYRKNGELQNFFQPLLRKDSDPGEVAWCIGQMLDQFRTDEEHLVTTAQKHTARIHLVTSRDLGPWDERRQLEYIDGLITDLPGVMLQAFGADCPCVYLVDPVCRGIGLCHSGRKGTQQHIAAVMLQAMTDAFGTDPQNVQAAISPGICRECYEVGDDVAEDFAMGYLGISEETPPVTMPLQRIASACASEMFITENAAEEVKSLLQQHQDIGSVLQFQNGKYHIDLPLAIASSLAVAGIPSHQIEAANLCTRCCSGRFYSFRAEGRISSENSALLMLRPD